MAKTTPTATNISPEKKSRWLLIFNLPSGSFDSARF
jgi:hypothetical protein